MELEEHDIRAGLVLHLDPDALRSEGAVFHHFGRYSSGPFKRRYYLCCAVAGEQSAWSPMYGKGNNYRLEIKPEHKRGPDYFTQGHHYVDAGTVCVCNYVQLVVGLRAGRDRASFRNRPRVVFEGIPSPAVVSGKRILAGEPALVKGN